MRGSGSSSAVPQGLGLLHRCPSLERLGYFQISLREMANRSTAKFLGNDNKKCPNSSGGFQPPHFFGHALNLPPHLIGGFAALTRSLNRNSVGIGAKLLQRCCASIEFIGLLVSLKQSGPLALVTPGSLPAMQMRLGNPL